MHHKDITLRHNDRERYDEWRIEDLVVMECGDHTRLHMEISGNCMSNPEVYEKHSKVMSSEEIRAKISRSMKQYRLDTKDSEKEKERNRKISEKLMGNHNFGTSDTRSIECYCIFDDKKYYFHNYKQASKWWYETLKPFGDNYSLSTFQRKINDSINGKEIKYRVGKESYLVTNIKWFKGGDVNE